MKTRFAAVGGALPVGEADGFDRIYALPGLRSVS